MARPRKVMTPCCLEDVTFLPRALRAADGWYTAEYKLKVSRSFLIMTRTIVEVCRCFGAPAQPLPQLAGFSLITLITIDMYPVRSNTPKRRL